MSTTATSRGDPTATPVAAGLDLLTATERHADRLALGCADRLRQRGGADVVVTTHPATLGERRHVALVVEVTGLAETTVLEVMTEVADADGADQHGIVVHSRSAGGAELEAVLRSLLARHSARTAGRVAVFPGQPDLPSTTTVAELLASTAVEQVQVLGGAEPEPRTILLTRGFLRPRWVEGRLVLHAQPAAGSVLVPFETPEPSPCCVLHG